MKDIRSVSFLALALAGLALSCDRKQSDAAANPAAPAEVRIGYFANLTHAQAVLGVASGEFATAVAPAKVTTKVFNAGPSLIEALLAGEIDVGYVGPGPALNAHSRTHGEGIRVVAAAASNGVVIVARDGSGIRTLGDLKGKKLATPQHGNTQDLAARHYLKDVLHQGDLQNVLPIANAEQAGMMSRGEIDASWAPEPWGAYLVAQDGAKIVGEEKDLWPNKEFTLTVVVTTPDFLAAHPGTVEQILGVHHHWTQRLRSEPEKSIPQLDAALYALTGKKLPQGVLPAAIRRVKFTDEPLQETFDGYGAWSYELGVIQQKPDLTGLVDTSILKKLQKQDAPNPHTETSDARNVPAAG